jgi:hypothetical protein
MPFDNDWIKHFFLQIRMTHHLIKEKQTSAAFYI